MNDGLFIGGGKRKVLSSALEKYLRGLYPCTLEGTRPEDFY